MDEKTNDPSRSVPQSTAHRIHHAPVAFTRPSPRQPLSHARVLQEVKKSIDEQGQQQSRDKRDEQEEQQSEDEQKGETYSLDASTFAWFCLLFWSTIKLGDTRSHMLFNDDPELTKPYLLLYPVYVMAYHRFLLKMVNAPLGMHCSALVILASVPGLGIVSAAVLRNRDDFITRDKWAWSWMPSASGLYERFKRQNSAFEWEARRKRAEWQVADEFEANRERLIEHKIRDLRKRIDSSFVV